MPQQRGKDRAESTYEFINIKVGQFLPDKNCPPLMLIKLRILNVLRGFRVCSLPFTLSSAQALLSKAHECSFESSLYLC
jgi:hypothetical protein